MDKDRVFEEEPLLPAAPSHRVAKRRHLSPVQLVGVRLVVASIALSAFAYLSFYSFKLSTISTAGCVQVPAYSNPDPDLNSRYDGFGSPQFIKSAMGRFSGAIQIPTVSYDSMKGDVATDVELHKPFLALHAYLAKTYPLVHAKLAKTVVNEYSLVFVWQGADPALKPAMLMAHQDVVPVRLFCFHSLPSICLSQLAAMEVQSPMIVTV